QAPRATAPDRAGGAAEPGRRWCASTRRADREAQPDHNWPGRCRPRRCVSRFPASRSPEWYRVRGRNTPRDAPRWAASAATADWRRAPGACCRQSGSYCIVPSRRADLFRLLVLEDEKIADRQEIDPGVDEAGDRILRRADDRLAAYVERSVDHHRAAGQPVKHVHQAMKRRVAVGIDSLQPCAVIDMRDRRPRRALLVQHRHHVAGAVAEGPPIDLTAAQFGP